MNLPIKFLKQNEEPFLPVTAAEAVVVKYATGSRRLDEVLRVKIEEVVTPVGSGLTSYPSDDKVIISHANIIDPSLDELKPKLIKYDNRGHIVETSDFEKLKVIVHNQLHAEYDGSSASLIKFGDDFIDDDGNILIRWNTIT